MAQLNFSDLDQPWVSWSWIFEVINKKIHLVKRIELWHSPLLPERLRRWDLRVPPEKVKDVEIKKRRAVFNNGYIEFRDRPLHKQIKALTNLEWDDELVSRSYFGEIVAVSAEVNLPKQGSAFPLFFYPEQRGEYVGLSINRDDGDGSYELDWRVSKTQAQSPRNYMISEKNRWHKVRVRQADLRRMCEEEKKNQMFEFLVGNFQLGTHDIPNSVHQDYTYESKSRTCYIGRIPDPNGDNKWLNLTGQIRYLEFDPNDSCPECRGS